MEEIETPIEKVAEDLHEHAHHSQVSWIGKVALFSALVAVVAAIAALLAGHNSNEAMIYQIKAANSWSYYQAKGIKSAILESKIQLLSELGKTALEADRAKAESYKKDQEEISTQAKEFQESSEHQLQIHEILARAVTFFQVSIAISAIAVLTKRRRFWWVGIMTSLIGLAFFIQGLLRS